MGTPVFTCEDGHVQDSNSLVYLSTESATYRYMARYDEDAEAIVYDQEAPKLLGSDVTDSDLVCSTSGCLKSVSFGVDVMSADELELERY